MLRRTPVRTPIRYRWLICERIDTEAWGDWREVDQLEFALTLHRHGADIAAVLKGESSWIIELPNIVGKFEVY